MQGDHSFLGASPDLPRFLRSITRERSITVRRIATSIALAIALSILLPSSICLAQQAPAGTTAYIYGGNHFTDCFQFPMCWPYTTHDSVVVFFTVSTPLPPNMPWSFVKPTSYIIDDGVQRLTSGSSSGWFLMATDKTGNPLYWQVQVTARYWWGVARILTYNSPGSGPITDAGSKEGYTGTTYFGKNTGDWGRWIVITTP
jgi:hypothetical protein